MKIKDKFCLTLKKYEDGQVILVMTDKFGETKAYTINEPEKKWKQIVDFVLRKIKWRMEIITIQWRRNYVEFLPK